MHLQMPFTSGSTIDTLTSLSDNSANNNYYPLIKVNAPDFRSDFAHCRMEIGPILKGGSCRTKKF